MMMMMMMSRLQTAGQTSAKLWRKWKRHFLLQKTHTILSWKKNLRKKRAKFVFAVKNLSVATRWRACCASSKLRSLCNLVLPAAHFLVRLVQQQQQQQHSTRVATKRAKPIRRKRRRRKEKKNTIRWLEPTNFKQLFFFLFFSLFYHFMQIAQVVCVLMLMERKTTENINFCASSSSSSNRLLSAKKKQLLWYERAKDARKLKRATNWCVCLCASEFFS